MKKLFTLLIIIGFLLSSNGYAQNWAPMNMPDLNCKWSLTGINFPDPAEGWAVGYNYEGVGFAKAQVKGVILHCKNGVWVDAGVTEPSTDWTLQGVFFLNTKEGWAYGQDRTSGEGLIMHYMDGAWKRQTLPALTVKKFIIYDLKFTSAAEGWAVGSTYGDAAPVLLEFTGGSWNVRQAAEPKKQSLLAVDATKSGHVYAGGFREGEFAQIGISRPIGTYLVSNVTGPFELTKWPLMMNNIICRDIVAHSDEFIVAVGWMPEFQTSPQTGKILEYNGKKWAEMEVADSPREWDVVSVCMPDDKSGFAVGTDWGKNKGLIFEFKGGKWTPLGKKAEPLVSDKWMLRSVISDGKGVYYTAGWDQKNDKGVVLKYIK